MMVVNFKQHLKMILLLLLISNNKMTQLKIAFGCQARVGKDTVCEYLQQKYGGKILRFAAPLYDILHFAQDQCGFPRSKDVKFLQWIGTEWAREQNPNVWIDCLLRKVNDTDNVYVPDLRFQNELAALRQNGFKCVRIVRNDRPIDRSANHSSEQELVDFNDWDAVIVNDGSIEDLYQKIDSMLITFGRKAR